MKEQLEKMLVELNIPFKKDVKIKDLVDDRTFAKIQLNYINDAYEHFEEKKGDLTLDEFIESFSEEEREKIHMYFFGRYDKE